MYGHLTKKPLCLIGCADFVEVFVENEYLKGAEAPRGDYVYPESKVEVATWLQSVRFQHNVLCIDPPRGTVRVLVCGSNKKVESTHQMDSRISKAVDESNVISSPSLSGMIGGWIS